MKTTVKYVLSNTTAFNVSPPNIQLWIEYYGEDPVSYIRYCSKALKLLSVNQLKICARPLAVGLDRREALFREEADFASDCTR